MNNEILVPISGDFFGQPFTKLRRRLPVDLVMLFSQHSHVKVKSAELKARLSLYLRKIRESGEPIEVLLRDQPVAYLTPIGHRSTLLTSAKTAELLKLKNAFAGVGLTFSSVDAPVATLPKLTPVTAGDNRKDVATVESIRSEKGW